MKKLLTITLAVLAGSVALHSQEARVAARLGTPLDAHIYTFLDGEFGEHFTYSLANHWVSGSGTPDLYRNTWSASEVNWCDWAYLTYSTGGFSISAGKIPTLSGLHDYSPDDVDNYMFLCNSFTNGVNGYQLSAMAAYTFESAGTTVSLQYSNSAFDEKPFGGHNTISFSIEGDYGVFKPNYALNRMTMNEDEYGLDRLYALSLGNGFQINDDLILHFDYLGKFAPSAKSASSFMGSVEYSFLDGMRLVARAGYEKSEGPILDALEFGDEGFYGGLAYEFRPVPFIRFHAAGAYNQTLGACYDFGVTLDLQFSK